MTQETIATDSNGNQVKTPGWFSWRHKTREAHDTAAAEYLSEHGPEARRIKAKERVQRYGSPANHVSSRGHSLGRCSCARNPAADTAAAPTLARIP